MSEMDKEALGLVLEEFTQALNLMNQNISDLITGSNNTTSKIEQIKREMSKPQATAVSEGDAFGKMALKEVVRLREELQRQPQSLVKKFQLLLFPEQDARLFYKIVFSRWLTWLTVMLAITNIYKWAVHYSDIQKSVQVEQLENDQIRKSWKNLYHNSGKETKRLMEKAYANSGQTYE